jgi:hypothetical protein
MDAAAVAVVDVPWVEIPPRFVGVAALEDQRCFTAAVPMPWEAHAGRETNEQGLGCLGVRTGCDLEHADAR